MRSLLVALTLVALVFSAGTLLAADNQVSNQTLAKMGLAGMERLSDAQGEQIRGKWFLGPLVTINAANQSTTIGSALSKTSQKINVCSSVKCGVYTVNALNQSTTMYSLGASTCQSISVSIR